MLLGLSSLIAGASAARRRSKSEIRKVVILQSQYRRKLAVRELRGLRAEAKSASKFKEISYQLENKVVELTQTLQKRSAQNRELESRVASLEASLMSWQGKHEDVQTRATAMEADLARPTVPTKQYEEAVAIRKETERKMAEAVKRVENQEKEIQRLTEELTAQATEMEQNQFTIDTAVVKGMEDSSTISSLRNEVQSLKEQMTRASTLQALTKGPAPAREPTSPMANGLRSFEHVQGHTASGATSRRRGRRHSTTGTGPPQGHARTYSQENGTPLKGNPRAVSAMFPQNGLSRPRDSNGLPALSDGGYDEVARLLEDDTGLSDDVLNGLVRDLKIPQPSLHNPPLEKEIIFPAHLISLVSNEMWKLGMIPESETFLANVMQAIQAYVMVSHP